MVDTKLMNWAQVADRLSNAPARIGGYSQQGQNLAIGSRAHITVIDPAASWVVDRDLVASKSRNTPFHGYELPGVVTHTFFNGIPTLINGVLAQVSEGR
jgi:dihydroorotase